MPLTGLLVISEEWRLVDSQIKLNQFGTRQRARAQINIHTNNLHTKLLWCVLIISRSQISVMISDEAFTFYLAS